MNGELTRQADSPPQTLEIKLHSLLREDWGTLHLFKAAAASFGNILHLIQLWFRKNSQSFFWQPTTTNVPLWFTRRYVNRRSRCRHVHREHVHPHLYTTLLVHTTKRKKFFSSNQDIFFFRKNCSWVSPLPLPPCLFDSRFVGIQQGSGLHMFGHELAAHPWDLLPVVEHGQCQVLLSLLLQAWKKHEKAGSSIVEINRLGVSAVAAFKVFTSIYHRLCRLSSVNCISITTMSQVCSGPNRKSLIVTVEKCWVYFRGNNDLS